MREDYAVGDPVMDAAQGRAMVVVTEPDQTVAEWSEANNYDLLDNYANGKFDPSPDEPAVECVYVSDVRSEPSKTYTFPASRLRLIDVHHADDGRRLSERVIVDLLEAMFTHALGRNEDIEAAWLKELAVAVGVDADAVDEAWELADVAHTVGAGEVSD